MHLVSFEKDGEAGFGAVTDAGIVDLRERVSPGVTTLKGVLEHDVLERAAALAEDIEATLSLDEVTLLPPLPDSGKIICVGLNYLGHVKEMGMDVPSYPSLFPRYPGSLVGHGDALVRPVVSERYDFEGELAVVIGRRTGKTSAETALDSVAGYTILLDGSIRDWQRHTSQYMPGKNFRRTGAMGPWLVTRDVIADPRQLTLETRLNGEVVQNGSVGDLVFPIPDLIAYITTFMDLLPGDVISTGTPSGVGVGREPPLFMKAGDQVEVSVSEIGTLANTVIDEN